MAHESTTSIERDPDFHVAEHLFVLSNDLREAIGEFELRMKFVDGCAVWFATAGSVQAKGFGPVQAARGLLTALSARRQPVAAA